MNRYSIENEGQIIKVVDTATNAALAPDCAQDMVAYHAYLIGKSVGKPPDEAQTLLSKVMCDERPITELKKRATHSDGPRPARNAARSSCMPHIRP
jgi:hypothetical protein